MNEKQKPLWYPRWYYVKRNKTSGKLYLGQHNGSEKSLMRYCGSGGYWINHNKINGGHYRDNIETIEKIWIEEKEKAQMWLDSFAEKHPQYWSTENETWANLMPESTEDFASAFNDPEVMARRNKTISDPEWKRTVGADKNKRIGETRKNTVLENGLTIAQSASRKGAITAMTTVLENGLTIAQDTARRGALTHDYEETSRKQSATRQSKEWQEKNLKTCPQCGMKNLWPGNYARWHGEKCRKK